MSFEKILFNLFDYFEILNFNRLVLCRICLELKKKKNRFKKNKKNNFKKFPFGWKKKIEKKTKNFKFNE